MHTFKVNKLNHNSLHSKENFQALNFELEKDDIEKLNNFRRKEFDSLEVDWNDTGNDIPIYKYANQFRSTL